MRMNSASSCSFEGSCARLTCGSPTSAECCETLSLSLAMLRLLLNASRLLCLTGHGLHVLQTRLDHLKRVTCSRYAPSGSEPFASAPHRRPPGTLGQTMHAYGHVLPVPPAVTPGPCETSSGTYASASRSRFSVTLVALVLFTSVSNTSYLYVCC